MLCLTIWLGRLNFRMLSWVPRWIRPVSTVLRRFCTPIPLIIMNFIQVFVKYKSRVALYAHFMLATWAIVSFWTRSWLVVSTYRCQRAWGLGHQPLTKPCFLVINSFGHRERVCYSFPIIFYCSHDVTLTVGLKVSSSMYLIWWKRWCYDRRVGSICLSWMIVLLTHIYMIELRRRKLSILQRV